MKKCDVFLDYRIHDWQLIAREKTTNPTQISYKWDSHVSAHWNVLAHETQHCTDQSCYRRRHSSVVDCGISSWTTSTAYRRDVVGLRLEADVLYVTTWISRMVLCRGQPVYVHLHNHHHHHHTFFLSFLRDLHVRQVVSFNFLCRLLTQCWMLITTLYMLQSVPRGCSKLQSASRVQGLK